MTNKNIARDAKGRFTSQGHSGLVAAIARFLERRRQRRLERMLRNGVGQPWHRTPDPRGSDIYKGSWTSGTGSKAWFSGGRH